MKVLGLIIFVALLWLGVQDRVLSFATPINYSGDALQFLGWAKASAEGDYLPLHSKITTRLGAPYQANWNDYAIYEEGVTWLVGRLVNWFGLMPACNLVVMLAAITTALGFYGAARWLDCDWWVSWVLAVLFAFSYYMTYRGLDHVLLTFNWTVPLFLVAAYKIYRNERVSLRWLLALMIGVGMGNVYWLMGMLQIFLVVALVTRPWCGGRTAGLAMGVALATFFLFNLDTINFALEHGRNPAGMPRNMQQLELYALKPIELLVPPPEHRWLGFMGAAYNAGALVRGEMFSPYLGVVALVGLAGIVVTRSWPHLMVIGWVLAFSVIGGLNSILGLLGICFWRGTNRYSVFIECVCLLWLAAAVTEQWRKKRCADHC